MAKRWLPLILALLAIALVACGGISSRKVRVLEDADSAVFNAVLRSVTINTSHGNEYLVVTSEPGAGYVDQGWVETQLAAQGKIVPNLTAMASDYTARNSETSLHLKLGDLNVKVVGEQALKEMFAGDVIGGWKRFWAKYPGANALVGLSLPGYSPDGTWAIISYSVSRGSLAGEVWVAVLHQRAGHWSVEWRDILVQS